MRILLAIGLVGIVTLSAAPLGAPHSVSEDYGGPVQYTTTYVMPIDSFPGDNAPTFFKVWDHDHKSIMASATEDVDLTSTNAVNKPGLFICVSKGPAGAKDCGTACTSVSGAMAPTGPQFKINQAFDHLWVWVYDNPDDTQPGFKPCLASKGRLSYNAVGLT